MSGNILNFHFSCLPNHNLHRLIASITKVFVCLSQLFWVIMLKIMENILIHFERPNIYSFQAGNIEHYWNSANVKMTPSQLFGTECGLLLQKNHKQHTLFTSWKWGAHWCLKVMFLLNLTLKLTGTCIWFKMIRGLFATLDFSLYNVRIFLWSIHMHFHSKWFRG